MGLSGMETKRARVIRVVISTSTLEKLDVKVADK